MITCSYFPACDSDEGSVWVFPFGGVPPQAQFWKILIGYLDLGERVLRNASAAPRKTTLIVRMSNDVSRSLEYRFIRHTVSQQVEHSAFP